MTTGSRVIGANNTYNIIQICICIYVYTFKPNIIKYTNASYHE